MTRPTPTRRGKVVGTPRDALRAFDATHPCDRCGEPVGESYGIHCEPAQIGTLVRLEALAFCPACVEVVGLAMARVGLA